MLVIICKHTEKITGKYIMQFKRLKNEYLETERELLAIPGKEYVSLSESDFPNCTISFDAYQKLTNSVTGKEFTVSLPTELHECYKSVKRFAAAELKDINQKMKRLFFTSFLLIFLGAICFVLKTFNELNGFFGEAITIICWVFMWTATERIVFGATELRFRKLKILRVVRADLVNTEYAPITPLNIAER